MNILKSYIWTADKDVNMKAIFRPSFHYCLSSVHYCEDRFHIHVFIRSSNIWLSYIHSRLFYFVVQVKKVNFKAGDKVGEGDVMVEIEHRPDHWDGNSILGGKGYHNFRVKWLFMSPWKWLTRTSLFEFCLEMPMTKWTDFFVPVKMTPVKLQLLAY